MRRWISPVLTFVTLLVLALLLRPGTSDVFTLPSTTFTLRNAEFLDGGDIPRTYTCDGAELHPPLVWEGLPEGTKSLAVVVEDADAPIGTFVHWVLWNIPPDAPSLHTDFLPTDTVEGVNSDGVQGWSSFCPPTGERHAYVFTMYALDTTLTISGDSDAEALRRAIAHRMLGYGTLIGYYGR